MGNPCVIQYCAPGPKFVGGGDLQNRVDRLLEYFDLPNTPENQQTLERTPVWVTDSVGDHHVATAISFDDLQAIPNEYRNTDSIGHAINVLRRFFNRRRRWWQV
jgi:hypothetical protein